MWSRCCCSSMHVRLPSKDVIMTSVASHWLAAAAGAVAGGGEGGWGGECQDARYGMWRRMWCFDAVFTTENASINNSARNASPAYQGCERSTLLSTVKAHRLWTNSPQRPPSLAGHHPSSRYKESNAHAGGGTLDLFERTAVQFSSVAQAV